MTVVLVILLVGLLSLVVFALYTLGFLQDPLKIKAKDKEDTIRRLQKKQEFDTDSKSINMGS